MLSINISRKLLTKNNVLNNSLNHKMCRHLSSIIKSPKLFENFESKMKSEKKRAKKYLLLEDNCNVFTKFNVENVSQLLDSKINKIFKWNYNKHNCILIELNDENYFMHKSIRKSFGLEIDSFKNNTRFLTINRLPKNLLVDFKNKNIRNEILIHQFKSRKSGCLLLNVKEVKPLLKTNEEFLNFLLCDKRFTELSLKLRFYIIIQLEQFITNGLFRNFSIMPFGSSIAGFGTPNSDLDLVLMQPDVDQNTYTRREDRQKLISSLKIIADLLQYSVPNYSHFARILKARIPIIKFWFNLAPIDIDLSIEISPDSNHSGVIMSSFLHYCHQLQPSIRDLIILIKIWAKQHGILKPENWTKNAIFPGFTSFQLTSLAIYFLQNREIVPPMSVFMNGLQDKNKQLNTELNSIELLRDFFEFVLSLKYDSEAISILNATTFEKRDFSPIYIQNPFDIDLNVCKNVENNELFKFLTFAELSLKVMSHKDFFLADVFDTNLNIFYNNREIISYNVEDLFIKNE